MPNYTGIPCPLCKTHFKENDDIVVCPTCATPYHRDCYNLEGKCIKNSLHEKKQTFKVKDPSVDENSDESTHKDNHNKKKCPQCLNNVNLNIGNCPYCSFEFKINSNATDFSFIFDPMGGVDPQEKFDKIKASDIAKFVRNNTHYYLHNFKAIKDKKKNKFNFSAFFLFDFWLFYRKQYKLGLAASAFVLLLNLLSLFLQINYPKDSYLTFIKIISLVEIIAKVFLGIYANKIYKNHCTKKINKIKNKNPSEESYLKNLFEQGGVNFKLIPFLFLYYFLLNFSSSFFLK